MNLQKGGHSGALACTRHLLAAQGVRGLFRGVAAPLVGGSLEAGVNYGVFARLYDALTAGDGRALSPAAGGLLAGAAAGVPIAVMLGPTELVKCRLQVAETARMGRDVRSAVRFILVTEGWRGLMRGTGATLAREVPGNGERGESPRVPGPSAFADEAAFAALYFGVYEFLKHTDAFRLDEGAGPLQRFGGTIVCGGLAGVAMWCACLPIDNLKTQIQTVRPGSAADLSLVGHLRRVVRLRGVAGLYAGLAPTIVRAFPANAAQVRPGARRGPLDPSAERG